jgi:type VI secretion system protein ImpE
MSINKAQGYLKQNDLQSALSAAAEKVKVSPSDEFVRIFFIELLCVNGELERADSQLTALMALKPDLALAISTWRQLIHSAQIRKDVFELKATPELVGEPTPAIKNSLDILVALQEKNEERLASLVESIDHSNTKNQFLLNDHATAELRNLDDIFANIFEVLGTNGKYFWIDFSQVVEMEFAEPTRLLDVIWRKLNITLHNGSEGEVYMPAIYPLVGDDETKLGRKTEWSQQFSLYQGLGLKTWLFGESELTVNDLTLFKNVSDQSFQQEAAEG